MHVSLAGSVISMIVIIWNFGRLSSTISYQVSPYCHYLKFIICKKCMSGKCDSSGSKLRKQNSRSSFRNPVGLCDSLAWVLKPLNPFSNIALLLGTFATEEKSNIWTESSAPTGAAAVCGRAFPSESLTQRRRLESSPAGWVSSLVSLSGRVHIAPVGFPWKVDDA